MLGSLPTDAYLRRWEAARAALAEVPSLLRPGHRACDVDADLRALLRGHGFAYPHHSGHSLGTTVHEFPRLVPHETAMIEADMVLMVEPGAYSEEAGGLRLELMFHVGASRTMALAPFEMRPSAR